MLLTALLLCSTCEGRSPWYIGLCCLIWWSCHFHRPEFICGAKGGPHVDSSNMATRVGTVADIKFSSPGSSVQPWGRQVPMECLLSALIWVVCLIQWNLSMVITTAGLNAIWNDLPPVYRYSGHKHWSRGWPLWTGFTVAKGRNWTDMTRSTGPVGDHCRQVSL